MIIIGIDPGIATTGFGVIKIIADEKKILDCGVITTDKSLSHSARLNILFNDVSQIIKTFQPDAAAVEKLFFASNVTTAMNVGEARGVVLLALEQASLSVSEFTPLQVKQSVTGYGKATKRQVQEMVKVQLKLTDIPKPDDAADALAVALTFVANNKTAPR
jgi:crossover junction endodeoxyribonuclease RuvC